MLPVNLHSYEVPNLQASSSSFRCEFGSVRRGASHHVNGEFVAFAPALGNESILRFAHNGIDRAKCRTIVRGKAIAPTSCTPRIVVACCGKDEKETPSPGRPRETASSVLAIYRGRRTLASTDMAFHAQACGGHSGVSFGMSHCE